MRALLVPFLLAVLMIAAGCSSSRSWERAMENTKPGMLRSEVVSKLALEAWYHQPCPRGSVFVDLFFFGSHQYDLARIVIVIYTLDSTGEMKVDRVGSFDDYAWQASFSDCVQRDRFED